MKALTPIQPAKESETEIVRAMNARLQDLHGAIIDLVKRIEALEAKVNP